MPPIKKTWADSTNELTSVTPDGTEIARLRKSDGTVVKSTTQAIGNLGTAALIADLASTANGKGASTIGIEDAGGLIAATNVEGALAENRTAIDAIEADYLQAADIANMLETSDIGVSVQGYSSVLANTTASFTTAQETKLGHISVTQAVDLDALETAVAALDQATVLKGSWDASAGTFPGAGAAQAGWTYIVSTGGTVDSVAFAQNDRILAIVDNASTSTYAANWFKLDYTDQVLSVASKTGAVTLAQADISGLTTSSTPQFAGIEIGHANDTTLSRIGGGRIAVEGVELAKITDVGRVAGDIFMSFDATPPSGCVELDGATISGGAATYPTVAARYAWMVVSGNIVLPDFRGRFPRGWAHGSSTDPDRASRTARAGDGTTGDNPGTYQADEIKSHQHSVPWGHGGGGSSMLGLNSPGSTGTVSSNAAGGNETRGKNLAVMFFMKMG